MCLSSEHLRGKLVTDCCQFYNADSGTMLLEFVKKAGRGIDLLTGYMFQSKPQEGAGLWLIPCNGVHTFGMRFMLDIILLDRKLTVVQIHFNVRPRRIILPANDVYSVLELPSGRLANRLQPGDNLTVKMTH